MKWYTVSDKVYTCIHLYAVFFFYNFPFCRRPQKLLQLGTQLSCCISSFSILKTSISRIVQSSQGPKPDLFSFVLRISVRVVALLETDDAQYLETAKRKHMIYSLRKKCLIRKVRPGQTVRLSRLDLVRFKMIVVIKTYKQKLKL